MIEDRDHWRVLPPDVQEWLELQEAKSAIPDAQTMLVETFPRGSRHFLVAYPFAGGLAHGTLCMLLTRRLERAASLLRSTDRAETWQDAGLPGTLKQFMRSQGIDPTGRRITMDNAAAIESWLSKHNIPHQTVDLTVGATN